MTKTIIAALALVPVMASAQDLGNIRTLLDSIGDLISMALPIVLGLALLAFFWGLAKFVFASGNEDAKEQGKRIMIWGVVALFVMVAVWGLVEFIANALDIDTGGNAPGVPDVPGL